MQVTVHMLAAVTQAVMLGFLISDQWDRRADFSFPTACGFLLGLACFGSSFYVAVRVLIEIYHH